MNADRIFDVLDEIDKCLGACYFGFYGYAKRHIKRDWIPILNRLLRARIIRHSSVTYTSGNVTHIFKPKKDIYFLISLIEKINNGDRISKEDILRAQILCITISCILCFGYCNCLYTNYTRL